MSRSPHFFCFSSNVAIVVLLSLGFSLTPVSARGNKHHPTTKASQSHKLRAPYPYGYGYKSPFTKGPAY